MTDFFSDRGGKRLAKLHPSSVSAVASAVIHGMTAFVAKNIAMLPIYAPSFIDQVLANLYRSFYFSPHYTEDEKLARAHFMSPTVFEPGSRGGRFLINMASHFATIVGSSAPAVSSLALSIPAQILSLPFRFIGCLVKKCKGQSNAQTAQPTAPQASPTDTATLPIKALVDDRNMMRDPNPDSGQ